MGLSIQIPVYGGHSAIIDAEDASKVSHLRWHVSRSGKKLYVQTTYWLAGQNRCKNVFLHRLILNAPHGLEVDHINRNTMDNRKSNLRLCTRTQNLQNSMRKNKTGFKGVYAQHKQFTAQIKIKKRTLCLGTFPTALDAAKAYDEMARKHFGQFALTNFQ